MSILTHLVQKTMANKALLLAICLCGLLSIPTVTTGQDTLVSASIQPALSIDDAVDAAISNDPAAQRIHWQIESAIAMRKQNTRRPNPTVGVVANEIGNEGSAGQYGVFLSRNIIRNDRLSQQYQIETQKIQQLQCNANIRKLKLSRQVTQLYLQLARLERELKLGKEFATSLTRVRTIAKRLFEGGEIPQLAVTGLDLEVERQQQVIQGQQQQIKNLKQQLAVLIGHTGSAIDIQFDWQAVMPSLLESHPDDLLDQILEQHPESCKTAASVEQSRWQVERARSEQTPDWQLQASINYDTQADDFFSGLQIGLPLQLNDRKSGLIRAAMADLHSAQEQLRLIRWNLHRNIRRELGEQQVTRQRLANLKKSLLQLAEKNDQQVRKAFEAGTTSFIQLKEALESVQQVRLMQIQLEYQLLISQARLETITSD